MNWITDPYVGSKATYRCHKEEEIAEHYICFDDFPTAAATAHHQIPAPLKERENEEEEPNKKDTHHYRGKSPLSGRIFKKPPK